MSREVGTGGYGSVHPRGKNSIAVSGLGYRKALVGTGWAFSLLLCTNGLRKQSSGLAWPLFLVMKTFSWPVCIWVVII